MITADEQYALEGVMPLFKEWWKEAVGEDAPIPSDRWIVQYFNMQVEDNQKGADQKLLAYLRKLTKKQQLLYDYYQQANQIQENKEATA